MKFAQTVILPCLRRKCFIRLSSRKLDPEGTGTERVHFNLSSRLPRRIWVWEQNPEGGNCMDPSPDRVRRDRGRTSRESQPPAIPSHGGSKAFPVMTTHPSNEETQAPLPRLAPGGSPGSRDCVISFVLLYECPLYIYHDASNTLKSELRVL